MKTKVEKELRSLWQSVRGKKGPNSKTAKDIEEFLSAYEWDLALEHILDWAAVENKLHLVETKAKQIRAMMQQSSAK